MKKIFLIGLLALVLFIFGCTKSTITGGYVGGGTPVGVSGNLENDVRVVNVKAFQFNFDPNPIIVNKGERVKLIVTSQDVIHGIAIPDFGINARLLPGRPTVVDFAADKAGNFPFACSVSCGAGHTSMRGSLIVR